MTELLLVSGLPRSGTSLMMRALGMGGVALVADGVRAADESNPHGYFEHESAKRLHEVPQWLEGLAGAVKVVWPQLRYVEPGPHRRLLWMSRALEDVARSWDAMLRRRGVLPDGDTLRLLREQVPAYQAALAAWGAQAQVVRFEQLRGDPAVALASVRTAQAWDRSLAQWAVQGGR